MTTETAPSDAERDTFVRAHPRGTVFHLAGWRRAVERAFGHLSRDRIASESGRIVGVLPLARCRKLLGGADLVSMPYAVYGGPIGATPEVERALIAEAVALGAREKVGRVELRCVQDPGVPDLVPSQLYATFVRDLPATVPEVMTRMPKRARAEVRKAIEKHGLVMEEGARFVPDLARLFGESKQRLGTPGLPRAWFEALAEELGPACVCHAAVRQAEVVAATMSFVHGDAVCFYYIGTTGEGNRTFNATNFLTTKLQEWGVEKGLRRFDLSRSRVGTGAYSFKENQGFTPTPLAYRYAMIGSRGLPALTPSNPRTRVLQRTWSRLPGWLARGLSGRLSRYLP